MTTKHNTKQGEKRETHAITEILRWGAAGECAGAGAGEGES